MAKIRPRDYRPQDPDKVSFLHWKEEVITHEELTYGEARLVLLDLLVNPQYRLSGGRPGSTGSVVQRLGFGLYDFSLEALDRTDLDRLSNVQFQGHSVWREFYPLTEEFLQLVTLNLDFEDEAVRDLYCYKGGIWAFRDALFALVLSRLFSEGQSLAPGVIQAIMEVEPDLYGRFVQFYLLVRTAIAHKRLNEQDWLTLEAAQKWAEAADRSQFVVDLYQDVSNEYRKQLELREEW